MSDLLGSRIAGGNTAYKRSKSDFYPTPPDVTCALLDFLRIGDRKVIWEPACGEGHMVDAMRERGYAVIGTDIRSGTDFLTDDCPGGFDWIITNPPFSKADDFIRRCAKYSVPFALLLKSQYWHARKRVPLFQSVTPSYVLPLTWRPDFMFKQRGGGSPLMDVMWCVWYPDFKYPTQYIPLERPKVAQYEDH